jgi:hypothetical protein
VCLAPPFFWGLSPSQVDIGDRGPEALSNVVFTRSLCRRFPCSGRSVCSRLDPCVLFSEHLLLPFRCVSSPITLLLAATSTFRLGLLLYHHHHHHHHQTRPDTVWSSFRIRPACLQQLVGRSVGWSFGQSCWITLCSGWVIPVSFRHTRPSLTRSNISRSQASNEDCLVSREVKLLSEASMAFSKPGASSRHLR